MAAAVIPISSGRLSARRGAWSLLEVVQPGRRAIPFGILLAGAGEASGDFALRFRDLSCFEDLEEQQADILLELPADLRQKGAEMGGTRLLEWLEDGLSNFLRIGDRTAIAYTGGAQAAADRLFESHVDAEVRRFVTHLPLYSLRAAATKFGEAMESELESWVRVPENMRLTDQMFVARVVGRSMEPLIPDDSLCVFRAPVVGSRNGRRLLIEKIGEADFSNRYTVKRYARRGKLAESADREGAIRLEPLNPDFEAFDLTEDQFRVIAEFVRVLY